MPNTAPKSLSVGARPRKTGFTLFPDLALELRLKVYEAAFPSSRVVEICPMAQKLGTFRPRLMLPTPLLHVSSESRGEALSFFKPVYPPDSNLYAGYINPREDVCFLNDKIFAFRDAVKELDESLLKNVEYLALDAFSLLFPRFPLDKGLEPLSKFKSLKVITLVVAYNPPKISNIALAEPFTIPISEWRARGVTIDDQTLLTDATRIATKRWNRNTFLLSQYLLDGMERLLPVLSEFAPRVPDWNLPEVDFKTLEKAKSFKG